MTTQPPALEYARPRRHRFAGGAVVILALAFLRIFAAIFAYLDPLPNPGPGEPVAVIACILTFLGAPPNLVLALCGALCYRKRPTVLGTCCVAAGLAGLTTAVVVYFAYGAYLHGIC